MQDCNNVELSPGNATDIEPINLLKGDPPSHFSVTYTLQSTLTWAYQTIPFNGIDIDTLSTYSTNLPYPHTL